MLFALAFVAYLNSVIQNSAAIATATPEGGVDPHRHLLGKYEKHPKKFADVVKISCFTEQESSMCAGFFAQHNSACTKRQHTSLCLLQKLSDTHSYHFFEPFLAHN